jgi:hypothetical protein
MNRLRKFIETLETGGRAGRTAYVMDANKLPSPGKDCAWRPVANFDPAQEVLDNPELKGVYRRAIKDGWAMVESR